MKREPNPKTSPPAESLASPASRPVVPRCKNQRGILAENKFFPYLFDGKGLTERHFSASLVCQACGANFISDAVTGRPRGYCSEDCRKIGQRRMAAEWSRQHGRHKATVMTCRHCLKEFPVGNRRQGRLPQWCSPACKSDTLRGIPAGPIPENLDMFSTLDPKGKHDD